MNLAEKVGPLPLGAWLVIAGGSTFVFLRQRNTAPTPVADTPYNGSANGGTGTLGGDVGSGPGGWVSGTTPLPQYADATPTPTPASSSTATQSPATLEEWAYKAELDLIGRGYSPTLVDTAIRKYVSGQTLGPSDWTIITLALALEGPPPQMPAGIPDSPPVQVPVASGSPASTTPTTVSTTPKPPTQASPPKRVVAPPTQPRDTKRAPRYYVVRPGDSLSKIALHFYGSGGQWSKIYNANRAHIKNPNVIHVGQRLVIPY